jgi:hypothetical protein
MFALGCILFEVTTGQKLFPDDWNIREYALKGEPIFPNMWPACVPGSRLNSLGDLAQALLDVDPFKRPSAMETAFALDSIRLGNVQANKKICGNQLQGQPPSPIRNITVGQVHFQRHDHFLWLAGAQSNRLNVIKTL